MAFSQEPWEWDNKRPDSPFSAPWGSSPCCPGCHFSSCLGMSIPAPMILVSSILCPTTGSPEPSHQWAGGLAWSGAAPTPREMTGAQGWGWPGAPSCPWEPWWMPWVSLTWPRCTLTSFLYPLLHLEDCFTSSVYFLFRAFFFLSFYPKAIYFQPVISSDKLFSCFGRILFSYQCNDVFVINDHIKFSVLLGWIK